MDAKDIIATVAIAISLGAVIGSYMSYFATMRRYQHPILVFSLADDKSWYVENVGNGTAINVDLVAGDSKVDWDRDNVLRLPALSSGGKHRIQGFTHCLAYATVYRDLYRRIYTTTVFGNANEISRENLFPSLAPTRFLWE